MSRPTVRACVVAYESGGRAVRACRSALDSGAQVVLVNNSSGDGTSELVREELPNVEVREPDRNLGFAAGSNRAAGGAATDYLLFLNPDAILDPGCLDGLVDALESDMRPGLAGPSLRFPDGRPQPSVRRDPTWQAILHQYTAYRFFGHLTEYYVKYRSPPDTGDGEVEVLMGSVLLVRRRLFEELGGFDERYFMYYEEADLCRRAREADRPPLFVSAATAIHEGGSSTGLAASRMAAERLVSAQRYVCRFETGRTPVFFRIAFLLSFPFGVLFDLIRDLLYALGYALWPPKHGKVKRKLIEALGSLRLLTIDLPKVVLA